MIGVFNARLKAAHTLFRHLVYIVLEQDVKKPEENEGSLSSEGTRLEKHFFGKWYVPWLVQYYDAQSSHLQQLTDVMLTWVEHTHCKPMEAEPTIRPWLHAGLFGVSR